jgi:hypothetical protein
VKEIDIAYCAGLFDGEGSVSLSIHNNNKTRKDGLPRNSPMLLLQLSSCDRSVLDWFFDIWQVGHVIISYRPKRPEHNVNYSWRVQGQKALLVLKTMLPFLKIKKKQAELAIEYMTKDRLHGKKIGVEEMMARIDFRNQMIALNKTERRIKNKNYPEK